MGKIMEAIFCVAYLIITLLLGTSIIKRAKDNKEIKLFGIMSLVLVSGDAFHLVPRVMAAVNQAGDYTKAMGIGTLTTSVTMTIFYLMLYFIYSIRYKYKSSIMTILMLVLSIARIVLCLLPQNDWTGEAPVIWGVYRNIPFTIMGIIMIILYLKQKSDKTFRWMWLAILLSFAFYIPVVLWADISPMIGMLMMPKTIMYVWIVIMGYKAMKRDLA